MNSLISREKASLILQPPVSQEKKLNYVIV